MSDKDRLPVARAVLQQCLHAELQVKPAEGDCEAQFVEVSDGFQCQNHQLMLSVFKTFIGKNWGCLQLLTNTFLCGFTEQIKNGINTTLFLHGPIIVFKLLPSD